jgi:hypothetical protein
MFRTLYFISDHLGTFTQRNYDHLGIFTQRNHDHLKTFRRRNYNHFIIIIQLQIMYNPKRTFIAKLLTLSKHCDNLIWIVG